MKLPLMGQTSTAYPSYSDILRAQLGGENFAAATESEEHGGETLDPKGGESNLAANEAVVEGSFDPVVDAHPSKKKKKKKKTAGSTEKAGADPKNEVDRLLSGDGAAKTDRVPDGVPAGGSTDLVGKAVPLGTKRGRVIDRDFPEPSGKKPCRSEDDLPLALKETSSLVERDLRPWGGPDPPFKKPLLASSEHLSFRYNKDAPFASDPDSCAELVRRIRGGMRMMAQISEFAFPDGFRESALADIEISARPRQLLRPRMRRLPNSRKMLSTRRREWLLSVAAIFANASRLLKRPRALKNWRTLEELENARSKVAQLEAEKADEAGRTKRAIDRMRQTHRRELSSATSCIGAAVTDCFEKFRQYITDRDRREMKLLLHGQAFRTLESMGTLEEFGMHIPKKLKDALAANEAMFRKEMEEVTVVGITEQDFVLPRFPGLDALQVVNQLGSNMGTVGPATASALRSPILGSEHPVTASSSSSCDRLKHTISGVHVGRPLGSALGVSTQETLTERRGPPIADSKGMEVAGVTGAAASSPIAED
ncbi:hypothetical protein Bca4012_071886 [Brassica carinata]